MSWTPSLTMERLSGVHSLQRLYSSLPNHPFNRLPSIAYPASLFLLSTHHLPSVFACLFIHPFYFILHMFSLGSRLLSTPPPRPLPRSCLGGSRSEQVSYWPLGGPRSHQGSALLYLVGFLEVCCPLSFIPVFVSFKLLFFRHTHTLTL